MPPDQPSQNPSAANDYNFILQNGVKRPGPRLPKLRLPRPIKIGLVVILVLVILIIISASRGSGGNSSAAINVVARQQEIVRVSTLAQENLQDQQTKNLQANVLAVMTTDKSQLIKLLGIKSGDGRLAKYRNSSTDNSLQTASQNNDYDQTYLTYIKQVLGNLTQQIQSAQSSASPNEASLLQTDLADAQALLASPQLTTL